MQLSVRDISSLLNVSEKTVYGWIHRDGLPACEVHGQYGINRSELLEWATSRDMHVPPSLFETGQAEPEPLSVLSAAVEAGGIFHHVRAPDKAGVLRAIVALMPLPASVDKELLLRMLLAREALASTGVGDGIALPHPRNPIVLRVSPPMVTLCFLDEAVEFGAIDGKPVHALFSLISPTPRVHLNVLARLSFALREPGFRDMISRRAPAAAVLAELRRIETGRGTAEPAGTRSGEAS